MAPRPSAMALDWLLVVSCAFCVALAVVYLFYSNRILALLVGYLLHLSWWNEGSDRAWVSLESFQVSLLSGRIMIKDLRYHSSNQSFRAIKCRVTWRYWLWRTRGETNGHAEGEDCRGNAKALMLPCRLHIAFEGVEWQLYNRTAAYNDIVSRLQKESNQDAFSQNGRPSSISAPSQDPTVFTPDVGNAFSRRSTRASGVIYPHPPSTPAISTSTRWTVLKGKLSSWVTIFKPESYEILPIDVVVVRGAIVCGNKSTPSLLVAKFSNAQGSYSIAPPRSLHDEYKTVIDAKFQNAKFDLERNHKYRGSLVQHGRIVARRLGPDPTGLQLLFSAFSRIWNAQKRRETQHKTDDTHAKAEADREKEHTDYAIVETILETPQLELSYYWDEPGVVPPVETRTSSEGVESYKIGNGDLAPQYGIDLVMHGGTARYGPWADRQRAELQHLFFPPAYQTAEPTSTIKPGDKRIYTALRIFVELRDTTTFHVPFREPSKDWQFDEVKFPGSTRKRREGGWLEIHAGRSSTISYILPWVAKPNGYDASLELHLNEVNALSSVNDIRLLAAKSSRVICELPVPLQWNDSRQWKFDVSFQSPTFHLIRDHINLLTDLAKDWSSGPSSDFDRWIPMHYVINVSLRDFEVNLYLNDHNIIIHPHARDANTLSTLRGQKLSSTVQIPSTVFRPQHTTIPFWIETPGVNISLTLPRWNTHSLFASARTTEICSMGFLRVDASFLYYSETLPEYIDQLNLDIVAREVVFIAFGWVVRHLMCIRDNYFGNFTHFSTLTEYVTNRNRNLPVGDPVELKWREGKSNVFEVTLGVQVEDSVVVLPAGLPGYEYSLAQLPEAEKSSKTETSGLGTCVVVLQPELQILLRTHDYSMEMSLNINPVTVSVVEDLIHTLAHGSYQGFGRQRLQIDGIDILANRLFGPQPRTSTYLCLWEFQIGAITGIMSTAELRGLEAALTSFRHNFIDAVNAPAADFSIPPEPDVTFLKLRLVSLDVGWLVGKISLQFCLPEGLALDFTDLAGHKYKKATEIRVPQAVVRALVCSGSHHDSWLEAGCISLDLGVDIYASPRGWYEAAKTQTTFVATQDALTRRAWFLYEPARHPSPIPLAYRASIFLPRPALPKGHCHVDTARSYDIGAVRRPETRPHVGSSKAVDSDEDEHIPEADRDARLAHSRPATPLLFNQDDDNRSISSSDESDNGDTTSNVSDSDSDGIDQGYSNIGYSGVSSPLLSHYKNIVRRFESHIDDTSLPWTPSLFVLVRDMNPPLDDVPFKATSPHPTIYHQAPQQASDKDSNSSLRLFRSNHIDILITPLCMHVLKGISDELFTSTSSIELMVDSLTKQYLSDAVSEKGATVSQDTFDAEFSTLRLRILQSVMAVDEAISPPSVNSPSPKAPPLTPGNSRIVSDIVLSLHGLSGSFSKTSGQPDVALKDMTVFRGSLLHVNAYLDVSVLHALSQMNRTPKVTRQCTLTIDESKVISNSDKFHMRLGDLHMQFLGKASPEMAAATLDSLTTVVQESSTYTRLTRHSLAAKQHQIWGVLQSCRSIPVGDPLTQTQPSFLIQRGRPLRIRRDESWKLFMYLRHCLRLLGTSHRKILLKVTSLTDISFSSVQTDDLFAILHEKLTEWGVELPREEVAALPFVRYCFHPAVHSSLVKPPVDGRQLSVSSFHSGTLSLSILDRQTTLGDTLDNTFAIGPFHLVYRFKSQKTLTTQTKVPSLVTSPIPLDVDPAPTRHHVLSAMIKDIRLTIHPNFIIFLQRLLLLHGKYFRRASSKPTLISPSVNSPVKSRIPDDLWECLIETKRMSIQAAVEGMVLEVGLTGVSLVAPILHAFPLPRTHTRLRKFISGTGLLRLLRIYMCVRQAQDKTNPFKSNGRDILTSLSISSLNIDTGYRLAEGHPPIVHGVIIMDGVMLSVPRSALLTYRLIEEWRTQYLPNIHAMTRDLFLELDKRQNVQPPKHPPQMIKWNSIPVIELQTSVGRVGTSLQVMHGTWFSWDVHNIIGFLRSAGANARGPRLTFGVQLASQLIRIGARPDEQMEQTMKSIKLALPSFHASGNYDGVRLRSHAVIDHFSLTLKPKYMDDILVVQQNLGTHFYDVLDLIAESRRNRSTPKKVVTPSINYDVAFMLQGFRVGIEGPTTTLALTSAKMTGTARNDHGIAWDFAVSDLALALSHHSIASRPSSEFDRSLRSAYMLLDVKASSSPTPPSPGVRASYLLRLQINRMHAVMSPNSIGELGDLIDHVQAEKHLRQEQRAIELQEIKNKTKRVMRAFEVQKPATSLKRSSSFLDNRTVLIDVADIGIAFPLTLGNEIAVDAIGSVPAFLMSIKTAAFSVRRYESGQASMRRLSFQFVKQFDQSCPNQFDGDEHQSRNKLLYPGMKAEFRSGTSTTTRRWHISAAVDGFILDLDPAIVDNVFGLVDVYRRGRERVEKLTTVPQTIKLDSDDTVAASVEASYLAIKTSSILVTLVFHTGKLHLHGLQMEDEGMDKPDEEGILDTESDTIQFPPITVWGEYRATPAASKLFSSQDQEPSILIFRSQVHSTINRIKPSIFPFLIGFVNRIEDRLRRPDNETFIPNAMTSPTTSDTPSRNSKDFLAPGVLNGIQLTFSLRIDSSKLELDCGHDLGVVAALHWESGGFLVTLSPRTQIAYFAGSVTGLQVDLRHLKHQAGTVQTAHVDARNLAFSVSYAQANGAEGASKHSVTVIVDTEFGAALRFDRLQDILIFKAIFIDRLPGTVPQPSDKPAPAREKSLESISVLTTLVLVRARHIKLLVDLGHNVAVAAVDLKTLVFRSRLVGPVTDLSLTVAHINLDLEEDRPLSGYMRLPDFCFTTVRRNDVQLGVKDGISKMLDVALASGTLDIVLQSEKRTLLQYYAQPFDIRIADDWMAIDWDLLPEDRTLRLDFSVVGKDVLAVANLQSIPRIIILLAKLRSDLHAQQAEARNALAISSIAQLPKPENALSEVADAMIRSARSKFSDGPAFSYIVVQCMKLQLSSLRVALFKNPNDLEMALFQGKDVQAELERIVHSLDAAPSRSLKLAFSSLYLSKYSSLKYRAVGDELMAIPWLEHLLKGASEWTIARVPAMNLEMNSDVDYEGRQEVLHYDLVATPDELGQSSRSIYVSLNLSLYIWAGALVKGLGQEIDKALVSSGFNKPAARAAAAAVASPPSLSLKGIGHDEATAENILSAPPLRAALSPLGKPSTRSPSPAPPVGPSHDMDAPLPRKYHARSETSIDYGTIQQLGEATPDAKAPWLGLKETVPPRVHEYATLPMEVMMKMLLEVYSKQLKMATKKKASTDSPRGTGRIVDGERTSDQGLD